MFSGFFLLCLFCALFARSSLWGEREGGGNFDPFEMMYNSHRGWWFIKVQCGGKWNVVGYYRLGVHRVLPTDGILPLAWPGPHWNTTNHTQKGKTIVWGEISVFGFSRSRQTFFFFTYFAAPVSWFLMSLSLTRSVLLSVRSKAMFARAQRPSQAIGHRTISSDCFKMLIRLPHPAMHPL